MRVRLAPAVAALLAAAGAPLAHAEGANGLSVDTQGTLGPGTAVTLSGTYRCLDDSKGPVFVTSTLDQDGRSTSIGGTRAVCDGHLHTWINTAALKESVFRPGTALVRAALLQLGTSDTGLPQPGFLAVQDADVTLRRTVPAR
jgi:hypothetical protein